MKKYWQLCIIITAFTGLLINVLVSSIEEPFNIFRGLGLFRYYTLQSNLIVLATFTLLLIGKFKFPKHYIIGVAVYITVTFSVFALMLSATYQPTGWNQVSNILSHYITPLLVIGYVIKYRLEFDVKMKDSLLWILYPVAYILFMIIFGSITNDYLYPFFQLHVVGLTAFILTLFVLVFYFLGLSFLFVKIVSFGKK